MKKTKIQRCHGKQIRDFDFALLFLCMRTRRWAPARKSLIVCACHMCACVSLVGVIQIRAMALLLLKLVHFFYPLFVQLHTNFRDFAPAFLLFHLTHLLKFDITGTISMPWMPSQWDSYTSRHYNNNITWQLKTNGVSDAILSRRMVFHTPNSLNFTLNSFFTPLIALPLITKHPLISCFVINAFCNAVVSWFLAPFIIDSVQLIV